MKEIWKIGRVSLWLLGFMLGGLILSPGCRAQTVEVIEIRYSRAHDLLPVVNGLLSPDGKVTVSERINALIVKDNEAAVENIRGVVASIDRPVEQLRVRIRFGDQRDTRGGAAQVEGQISGDHWQIGTAGRRSDGVDIHAGAAYQRQQQKTDAHVVVASGAAAFIRTGRDIPYQGNWSVICNRHRCLGRPSPHWQRITTGFEVRPVLLGENVDITITPYMADQYSPSKAGTIRFAEAAARLTVPLGQWQSVGGIEGASKALYGSILSGAGSVAQEALDMAIKVDRF
jgi:hypothetical protein